MKATLERPYYNLMIILKKRGMTQTELSEMTGIERTSLCSKMAGKRIMTLPDAKKIANALQISCDEIN